MPSMVGDLDLAAESRRGEGDGHAALDVGAFALEDAVRGDADEDVEIARRAAAHAGLAFAGQADAGAVLDAFRDLDRERLFALHAALAAAGIAGIGDHPALAAAGRAGALDGEEALLRAHAPCAPAAGAGTGRGTLAAGGIAGLAAHGARHPDLRLLAFEGLFERDFQVVAQIGAPALRTAAALAAHEIAEQIVEHVGEAAEVEIGAAGARPPPAVLERGMTELVIGRALLVVLQDLVGFVDFLEALLGRLVARVAVGGGASWRACGRLT